MTIDFRFDIDDTRMIPGLLRPWGSEEPYLIPVFFNKEVLVRYFYDPRYMCEFASETYGSFYNLSQDFFVPFGINPNGKVVAWLGDIKKLPESEQNYLASENVDSDHDITSEFYEAQINVVFTEPIKEVEIILLKYKINSASKQKYGFNLFAGDKKPEYDEIMEKCSRYKRLAFQNEDDFKRFVSEWNEFLVEDINHPEIKNYLSRQGVEHKKDIESNKSLQAFIKSVLQVTVNIIAPFFYLYDLRIWSNHKGADSKLMDVVSHLGLDADASNERIYRTLIEMIEVFLSQLLEKLQKESA